MSAYRQNAAALWGTATALRYTGLQMQAITFSGNIWLDLTPRWKWSSSHSIRTRNRTFIGWRTYHDSPCVWLWCFMRSVATPYICMASSLVGEITMAAVPFLGMNLAWYMSSTHGIRNARVLPDPAYRIRAWSPHQYKCTIPSSLAVYKHHVWSEQQQIPLHCSSSQVSCTLAECSRSLHKAQ